MQPDPPMHLRCEYAERPMGMDESNPRLSWQLAPGPRGQKQTAYQILVASSKAALESDQGDLWNSDKVDSGECLNISYGGKELTSRMRCHWKVRIWDQDGDVSPYSEPSWWEMALLENSEWKARWIEFPYPVEDYRENPAPATMLRKEVSIERPISEARAYVSALGLYELRINGKKVGRDVLTPGWTDYNKRVQYQTYDVTGLLKVGRNALAALCAEGWYAGRIGWDPERWKYGGQPRFLLQIELRFNDGSVKTLCSSGNWKGTIDGQIRYASMLDGELHDNRFSLSGWDIPNFDDGGWGQAREVSVDSELVPQKSEPMRVTEEIVPVGITEPMPGVFVFDLGQNISGWCRLRAELSSGDQVRLRHAEALDQTGNIYVDNLRSASQTDVFVAGEDGEFVFEPKFTCHGFRYVEVKGLRNEPTLDTIRGCVVHSDVRRVGRFECSNPDLNKLMENILWTQRDNIVGVPTDCPQRDERLGWMGDAQAFCQTSCFNMDMIRFYSRWLREVRGAQCEDGRFPNFAPNPWNGRFLGSPAWGDAGVIIPWVLYLNYGDIRLLKMHYPSARRWVEFIRERNPDLIWREERGNDYGDWLNGNTLDLDDWSDRNAEMPKDAFATAFFAYSVQLLEKMAGVLGNRKDEREYGELYGGIKDAYVREFIDERGRIAGDAQACYAISLCFDLVPDELKDKSMSRLLELIQARDDRLSTGFHGTKALMSELVKWGQIELAYGLLQRRGPPSWMHMIDEGATTIWERWDGYVEGRGFQDPGMNSFNHYAFGSIGEWVYENVVGISPSQEHPAWKKIIIRPQPGGGLTEITGEHDSVRGRIGVSWMIQEGQFLLDLEIPPNSWAEVHLPCGEPGSVRENGMVAQESKGVSYLGTENERPIFEIESGEFHFSMPYDPGKRG